MSQQSPPMPHQGWANQSLQYPKASPQIGSAPPAYNQNQPYYTPYAQQPAPYIQPYYANNTTAPIIAELPAPLPPAPATTTSEQQLRNDELLAHKLSQIDLQDVRQRSNSALSQQQRPVSIAPSSLQGPASLSPQQSFPAPRPHSQSLASDGVPWSPGSFGAPLAAPTSTASWPEVVAGPRSVSNVGQGIDEFPIPVMSETQTNTSLSIEIDAASSSTYLEEYRQPPYPQQWRPLPVIATFFAYPGSKTVSGSDWLTQQESCTWRTIRPTEQAYNSAPPSYTFNFVTKGGSLREPRFTWTMICPEDAVEAKKKSFMGSSKPAWSYDLRLHRSTGIRKNESLHHGKGKHPILTTYVHARNYDSLRFVGPDGRAYMWVSSGRVSSINGSRFDTNRHALFASVGQNPDPLYGEIVADHTYWDGYVDENEVHKGTKCDGCQTTPIKGKMWKCKTCHQHDVCETCRTSILSGGFGEAMQQACIFSLVCLPDEALCIRSPVVDPALIVATIQVLKDWERHTIRAERKKYAIEFKWSEDEARKYDLGVISYWKASDFEKKKTDHDRRGTVVKARKVDEVKGETASALGNLVDAGFALSAHGHGKGGGPAGDGKTGASS